MAGSSNIGQHALLWLLLPIVLVFVVPAVPDLHLDRLSRAEIAGNERLLGIAAEQAAQTRATDLFERLFVRDGLLNRSFAMFAPAHAEPGSVATERSSAAGYLKRLWWTVFKGCYRFEIALSWFVGAGIVVAAAFLDGTMRRRIKSYEFGYSSPVAFHFSSHGLVALSGLLLAMPFLPFGIEQWAWPLLIAGVAFVAWKVAESYQTGI